MIKHDAVAIKRGRVLKSTASLLIALTLMAACLLLSSCTTTSGAKAGATQEETAQVSTVGQQGLVEEWGVEVVGIRQSAAGYMLDFRYKVIDADKAAPILNRKSRATLIDEASGATVNVPVPAKIGPLRQTIKNSKPKAGTTYMVLFANPGRFITPGSKVTVAIGDFKAENLTVQ